MNRLNSIIAKLPNTVYVKITGLTYEDMNTLSSEGYDQTLAFRTLISKTYDGAEITDLFAAYYQGWEMDLFAANVKLTNGDEIRVSTSHGHLIEIDKNGGFYE